MTISIKTAVLATALLFGSACAPAAYQMTPVATPLAVDPTVNPSFFWGGPFLDSMYAGAWVNGVWVPTPELGFGTWGPPGIATPVGFAGPTWGPPAAWGRNHRGFAPPGFIGGAAPVTRDHRWQTTVGNQPGFLNPPRATGSFGSPPMRSFGGGGGATFGGVRDHRR